MGIYISNLKIPKDGYLPINIYPDGRVACRFDANCANAIEIPPHGRLIDADALPWVEGRDEHDNPTYLLIKKSVDVLPTIIPASEEVYGQYTDTAGNHHWCGVHSGEHTIKTEEGER